MQVLLFYLGSSIILLWGIGHLIPTRNVVSGFGDLSLDNKRIITMEWIAEGLALCFLGGLWRRWSLLSAQTMPARILSPAPAQ